MTLYSQQVRALNLAFSLFEERRLSRGAEVLVIGAGAAGLTFAAGAAQLGARVTVLERLGQVLSTFRGNHTRWLHPHIYEWPRPGAKRDRAELPLMDWSAGTAGDVARKLLTQWHEIQEELNIRVLLHAEYITHVPGGNPPHVFTWNAPKFESGRFSAVVFAVGFGDEMGIPGAKTPRYWTDDGLHQHFPDPGSRFLVSGIGDGGLVDLLRLRLQDFRHEHIVQELLSDSELEPVEQALLDIEEKLHQQEPSSHELLQQYQTLPVPGLIDQRIRERLRNDNQTVLNSPEPFPLSAKASILNRFLLSRLLMGGHLQYLPGSITKVEPQRDDLFEVHFNPDRKDSFHRVIIRHGTAPALERDFSWLWSRASGHLRSINELDQTRDPIWRDQTFSRKQTCATEAPHATPSPRLPKAPPLIGRKQAMKQLLEEILTPNPRPVVVLGAPGIGKSTLAIAALEHADAEKRYAGHRYFARLEEADTRETVAARIAQSMRLTSVSDSSARVLTELDKDPALLVLDNADTPWMKDRPGTEDLLQSLASIPKLALIITLRGHEQPDFGIPSHPISVPRMSMEESLQLFRSIAYNVEPDDPDLQELLKDMEGVPLAVKLMAKQAQGVKLKVTLRRWRKRRTAMLQSGSGQGSSLAASIEFSLTNPILSQSLRLLSALSLLPAGLAEEALDSIFPESDDAIARLQKAALVESEGERWRLLVVIREHVRSTRPARPDDTKKLIGFYFSLARRLGPRIGKANGHEALNQLAEEIDNLEELLARELEGEDPDAAIDTALDLSDFIRFSGRGSTRPLEKAREVAKQQENNVKEAQCLLALSRFHLLRRPQYGIARQHLQEALRLFELEGDARGVAASIRELGHTAANEYEQEQAEGKLGEAEAYFHRARAMQKQFDDPVGEAYCIHGLARIALLQDKREDAHRLFSETLQSFREQEDLLGQAYSLRHLGELDEDDALLRDACKLFDKVGELHNLGHSLRSRGDLAQKSGRHEEAGRLYRKALDQFLKLQALREANSCRIRLARVLHADSNPEEARELLEQALESARKLGDKRCEEACYQLLKEWGAAPV
ncbi:FAD-dependent oxidoreductase [Archangium gephyra]|uniref:FAD-dependent oxidoreductase n=1 Tax=Archangium gephyra TaxID=48 RepID=UPI003B7946DA